MSAHEILKKLTHYSRHRVLHLKTILSRNVNLLAAGTNVCMLLSISRQQFQASRCLAEYDPLSVRLILCRFACPLPIRLQQILHLKTILSRNLNLLAAGANVCMLLSISRQQFKASRCLAEYDPLSVRLILCHFG